MDIVVARSGLEERRVLGKSGRRGGTGGSPREKQSQQNGSERGRIAFGLLRGHELSTPLGCLRLAENSWRLLHQYLFHLMMFDLMHLSCMLVYSCLFSLPSRMRREMPSRPAAEILKEILRSAQNDNLRFMKHLFVLSLLQGAFARPPRLLHNQRHGGRSMQSAAGSGYGEDKILALRAGESAIAASEHEGTAGEGQCRE